MDLPLSGAAALLTAPIQVSLPAPSLAPSDGELGDLVHRLEALVRWLRVRGTDPVREVVRFGAVEVEPLTQTIWRQGRRVPVTRTEFRLLYALLRRPGEIVERDQLVQEVWGPEVRLRSRVIDTHIARLRRKLEDDPARPRHIRTAPYRGYRFDHQGG